MSTKNPVIDCTDLYHPHQDPGDNFDIITPYREDSFFLIENGCEIVAIVHLNWSTEPELDAECQLTALYESLQNLGK